jgi:hypothetical protein
MGSSSGSQNTTTRNEPPAFIQPYLRYGAEQSRGLYEQGPNQYYPGNTVVPFAPQTEQALGRTEQRALQGSPVNQAAQGYAANTLNSPITSQFGGASNPYQDAQFNRAADATQNRLQSAFAGSGRNLGGARAPMAQELNDLATGIYGGGYENERNRMAEDLQRQRGLQFGVAGLAPQLANQDYVDLNALGGVGGQVEDLTGRLMEDQAGRWDFSQNAPDQNLDQYLARVTGAYPGSNTTATTPTYRNRTAGALGGAATGAMMGSQIMPGWGTAIGAVAGGLLGGYGKTRAGAY